MFFHTIGLSFLPFLALSIQTCSAALGKRADSSFQLYAYGSNIGGYTLMLKDEQAYAVAPSVDASLAGFTNITFSFNSTGDSTLIATPQENSTYSNGTSTFTFGLGSAYDGNSSVALGSNSSNVSSDSTTGWVFYGNTLLKQSSDGYLVSDFYSAKQDDGIFGLWWVNNTDSSTDGTAVALRRIAPSGA